jgi:hypothetical protein
MPPFLGFGGIVAICVGAGVVAFWLIMSVREGRERLRRSRRQRLFDTPEYGPAVGAGRIALGIGMAVVIAIIVWAAAVQIYSEIEEESRHPTPTWAK